MTEGLKENTAKVYLPGLNALRFFAAFLVLIAHVELLKMELGEDHIHHLFNKLNFGGIGVYFFFVLSGFLITYLLIVEKERTGTINVKSFYVRRLLRIWPLYYLIALLGFFVFPHIEFLQVPWLIDHFHKNFTNNLWLFMLMLPNAAFAFMKPVPHIGQLWSIGVEEQFYLIWPNLFKRTRNLLRLIVSIFFGMVLLKVAYVLLLKFSIIPSNDMTIGIKRLLAMSKFECMIVGAFGAYLVKENKTKLLNLAKHKFTWITSLLLLPILSYITPESIDDVVHLPYSFIFLIIILNISVFNRYVDFMENKLFTHLGNISYGIYMYHMVIVVFTIRTAGYLMDDRSWMFNVFVYISSLVLTIVVASLSYKYFEQPFLRLKNKFTIIPSGKK